MAVSVTDPVQLSLDRTKAVLFKPFDLGKWLVMGFCAFLAYLGESSVLQVNFDVSGFGFPGGSSGASGRTPGQWLLDQLHWLGPAVAGVVMLGVAVLALLTWVRSRGKFLFLAAVASNRAAVVEPWKRYRELGNSLFRFQLVVLLLVASVVLIAATGGVWLAWPDLMGGDLTSRGVGAIVLGAVVLPIAGLAYLAVGLLVEDFLAPAMFARQARVGEAWALLRHEVFAGNVGLIVLFYLMRLLIAFVVAMISFVVTCLTCCLAAMPYIGTVILLPLFVFQRCYSLYFLQQFGGAWQIFTPADGEPPTCPVCGYDLRGNPNATHCPECGCDLASVLKPT